MAIGWAMLIKKKCRYQCFHMFLVHFECFIFVQSNKILCILLTSFYFKNHLLF
jgi:hypothetical protein